MRQDVGVKILPAEAKELVPRLHRGQLSSACENAHVIDRALELVSDLRCGDELGQGQHTPFGWVALPGFPAGRWLGGAGALRPGKTYTPVIRCPRGLSCVMPMRVNPPAMSSAPVIDNFRGDPPSAQHATAKEIRMNPLTRGQARPHLCRGHKGQACGASLGSYAVYRWAEGSAPSPAWRGVPNPGLSPETFEGRPYIRIRCSACRRNEKIPLSKYDPSTSPIYI